LPFYDGSLDFFTMRQFNILYHSTYSILSKQLYGDFGQVNMYGVNVPFIANYFISGCFLYPITHEEAHRSILTYKKIGAISQPIFNLEGKAYVKGVTDSTLQNFRDTDFSMFIRMHTAGIESDYVNMMNDFSDIAFNLYLVGNMTLFKQNLHISYIDYIVRMLGVWNYQFSGCLDALSYVIKGKEPKTSLRSLEKNELERDIVGHDVYGMIHHLFNPDVDYSRYWTYGDLSDEEKEFSHRIAWRSWINLVTPMLFLQSNFQIIDNSYLSGNAGYCIAPFGDFIDENIFFKYDKFNISFYARQAQNRNSWFPAFGLGLVEYKPVDWFSATVRGHFWMQPENLDFNTSLGVPGGAGEVSLSFVLPSKNEEVIKGVGINIGALYKTKGFMPEIESHDAHFRLSAGLVVRY
ncbi:MAG TPA: hypothetical protein PLG87_05190, partial [Treponemataceae bacterium]|nr:hypothetical protein [Treponemataceae bacterium]